MNWRQKGERREDPEKVLVEARAALIGLRSVLADFRSHLDDLEAEVRQPNPEEV